MQPIVNHTTSETVQVPSGRLYERGASSGGVTSPAVSNPPDQSVLWSQSGFSQPHGTVPPDFAQQPSVMQPDFPQQPSVTLLDFPRLPSVALPDFPPQQPGVTLLDFP
jgi:hypothetical protein